MFGFAVFLFGVGCSSEGQKSAEDSADGAPPVPPQGHLRIEEVYYAGSPPAAGRDHYFNDQFVRLRNISDAPVEAGGLLIGDAYGLAGEINAGDTPDAFADDPEVVALANLWRIPGEPADVLVAPGDCLVVAQDAGQHQPYSAVDLWDADFETVISDVDDTDDAVVPNLEPVLFTGGIDWLVTVFGPTLVVLAPVAEDELDVGRRKVDAPAGAIVDTMEALMDADSGAFKRLHPDIDAGFTHVSGTYTGESVRRRTGASGELQDTDDSGADFTVMATPEPGCPALE
jgi:Protein of unknown function (DUF4876)